MWIQVLPAKAKDERKISQEGIWEDQNGETSFKSMWIKHPASLKHRSCRLNWIELKNIYFQQQENIHHVKYLEQILDYCRW